MKIACIDVDHIFYLSLTGEKILDENGEPIKVDNKFTYRERTFEESCKVADNYITNILNLTEATHYVGFFGGSSNYRKTIYPDYKANRKDLEPLPNLVEMKYYLLEKWKFVWLNPHVNFNLSGELLPKNNYETDDYVASFVKQVPDSFIVSPDKDLLGLEGSHYNPKKNEWVYTADSAAMNNFWCSMICGDTADNIKGLPGKGLKHYIYVTQDVSPLDAKYLGQIVFEEYVKHYEYNYDLAIKEFYKNYQCLKIKDDLDISTFAAIEWNNTIIEEQNYDIT
jgi:5'-3' exonuclease